MAARGIAPPARSGACGLRKFARRAQDRVAAPSILFHTSATRRVAVALARVSAATPCAARAGAFFVLAQGLRMWPHGGVLSNMFDDIDFT